MNQNAQHAEEERANGAVIPLVAFNKTEEADYNACDLLATEAKTPDVEEVCCETETTDCGLGPYKPQCLQRFNNPQCLLFFFALYAAVLGFVVNGVNNVNTTSIERRFNLASARVGFISSAYDVSAAILGLIISYFGAGQHKARVVGIAVIISSAGSIVMALPHFITGPYRLGEDSTTSICERSGGGSGVWGNSSLTPPPLTCAADGETYLSNYLYMFILGQMLHGVGGTTIYTVGVSLIDDSVAPSSTPMYLGILYGCAVIGPGLGYVVGVLLLPLRISNSRETVRSVIFGSRQYILLMLAYTQMTQDDPRWVGAWWLGFLFSAVVNLMLAIPIMCYGAELPTAKKIRLTRQSQAHAGKITKYYTAGVSPSSSDIEQTKSFKHFCATSVSLLCNPCFLFISLSMVTEGISLSGVATFMPKMIENKFRVSASTAAMLSGLAVVPGAASGQFMGGIIAKRLKLTIPGLIKLCIVGMTLSLITVAIVWIDCGQELYVGVSSPYAFSSYVICKQYSNCSCLEGAEGPAANLTVKTGCRNSCTILYPFLILLFLLIGFTMIAVAPGDAIQLRCVPEEHKTYAQGLKLLIVRSLGTVVGPIITGRLLDNTCMVWRENCGGGSLSCWLYDIFLMSLSAYVGVVLTKILSIVFCLLALWTYRPPVVITSEHSRTYKNETAL
ncbi:hypothetical protein BaRGS_00029674 [Batillaria attramentaria]|uniref:Major facilitator superfamily (MFS) profile domain-containing protein n=1 Tax=Batillaria attramentaria TaxID=370345 RepID=A0ABD0JVS2_9CAEN